MRLQSSTETPNASFTLLKEELRKQIPRISILVALALVGTAVALIQPYLFKLLIDTAIPTADVRLIGLLLAGMMIVPVPSAGLNSVNHYLRVHIGEGVAQRLRQELFDHLLHVRLVALEQFTSGEHVHRLTRSCGRIGEVYVSEHLLPLAMNAILLIGTLAAMTALHWRLSLLALLAFQNVSFDYGRGDFGAQELTFNVAPSEFIGIVGPSGGGKSTIIDLIMGFYTPQSGTIMIDGIDLHELSLESLRSRIGLVSQDTFLWNATISENILYPGRDDAGRSRQAAREAQIDDFITGLPDAYQTVVGERGMTLSGGERQRLAIARALLLRPRLLLLDEATSALDALTEQKVRVAIDKARAGRTAIVVAHRLTTILNADRILVIDQGRIVEMGSRTELLARQGLFSDLYQAQSLEPEQ